MKKILKAVSMLLAAVMLLSFAVTAGAVSEQKTLNMLCYNVAGLPGIKGIMGVQDADVPENQKNIGKTLNGLDYDVIAVQEDFGYHKNLAAGLTSFPYVTVHTGGIPGGDGLNVFSKTPVYNEQRTSWEQSYGVVKNGADELTPKGILYTVLDIGDGIYIDLYVLHADAGKDEGSTKARNDNFRQLKELINANDNDRPIIVTGDFNTSSHLEQGKAFTNYMIGGAGFKDAWTELYNDGNYHDYSKPEALYGETYRGVWDSIEKFLYKDGGGVHIEVDEFEYIDFRNETSSLSDHKAASAVFTFEKTDDFKENTEELFTARYNAFNAFVRKIKVIFDDLKKLISHAGDVFGLLGK